MSSLGQVQKLFGGTLPAFDAFLLGRGLKTLDVRMERHNRTALHLAQFLEKHPKVCFPSLGCWFFVDLMECETTVD